MRPAVLATFLLAAGCSTVSPTETLQARKVCCETYREIPSQRLAPRLDTSLVLDANSPVFAFPEGKSYVAKYSLPPSDGALEIRAYLNGQLLPSATAFVPQVLILDSEHRVRQDVKNPKLVQRATTFKGAYWSAAIPVSPDDAYVIIYSTLARDGATIKYRNYIGYGVTSTVDVPIVPTGNLEILLQ